LFRNWRIEMSKKSDLDAWRWEHYTALKFRHPATQGCHIISQSNATSSLSSSIFLDGKIKFLQPHKRTEKVKYFNFCFLCRSAMKKNSELKGSKN
jgi:hypothetical protein